VLAGEANATVLGSKSSAKRPAKTTLAHGVFEGFYPHNATGLSSIVYCPFLMLYKGQKTLSAVSATKMIVSWPWDL
jgi:hypothetical protein